MNHKLREILDDQSSKVNILTRIILIALIIFIPYYWFHIWKPNFRSQTENIEKQLKEVEQKRDQLNSLMNSIKSTGITKDSNQTNDQFHNTTATKEDINSITGIIDASTTNGAILNETNRKIDIDTALTSVQGSQVFSGRPTIMTLETQLTTQFCPAHHIIERIDNADSTKYWKTISWHSKTYPYGTLFMEIQMISES